MELYRSNAVFTRSAHGVEPTVRSKILAHLDETEERVPQRSQAKLKYVTTRPYWNEPQAKPKMY